jgi:hypothetical protein
MNYGQTSDNLRNEFISSQWANNGKNVSITGGNVGIGTTNPTFPLHVVGASGSVTVPYSQISGGAGAGFSVPGTPNPNLTVGIFTSGGIWSAGNGFISTSDERIKKNIKKLSNNLEKILKLDIVEYTYIDTLKYGTATQVGFTAQNIQKVFSDAIKFKVKEFIPNIFRKIKLNNNIFHLEEPDGTVVRVYDQNNQRHDLTVRDHKVEFVGDEVFVYGKEVDDLLAIEKDALFCLSIGAIQELSEKVSRLEEKLKDM